MNPKTLPPLGVVLGLVGAFALGWWCHPIGTQPSASMSRPSAPAGGTRAAAAAPADRGGVRSAETPVSIPNLVAQARRGPTRAARLLDFARGLERVSPAEYPDLLRALLASNGPDRTEELAMLCHRWAEHAGAAAFEAGRELAARDGEYCAFHAAIAGWACRDSGAARAALREAGFTDPASDEMAALLQGWGSSDATGAEAYLQSIRASDEVRSSSPPAAVQRSYEAVARARIAADVGQALAWYRGLSEPLQERLRQTIVSELGLAAPTLAQRWLAEDVSAQLGASDLIPLLRALPLAGFDQQFAWAQSMANATTRESALAAVVCEGAWSNLSGLGEWLAVRSDDATLAAAFSAYATQVVRRSPNAAVTWASSLDDRQLRQQTLNAVAQEWMSRDPRAAREWATQSGLVDWEALMR